MKPEEFIADLVELKSKLIQPVDYHRLIYKNLKSF